MNLRLNTGYFTLKSLLVEVMANGFTFFLIRYIITILEEKVVVNDLLGNSEILG